MAIIINEILFGSKKKASSFIKDFRDKLDIGVPIKGVAHFFLLDLINYHPKSSQKIGEGIEYFTLEIDPIFKNKHFVIHRKDGSCIDFSYLSCLQNPTPKTILSKAARNEIAIQILCFKYKELRHPIQCPISGILLTSINSHVDHKDPEFILLFENWMKHNNYNIADIQIVCNKTDTKFKDRDIALGWRVYHSLHAELRLMSGESHRKQHGK